MYSSKFMIGQIMILSLLCASHVCEMIITFRFTICTAAWVLFLAKGAEFI